MSNIEKAESGKFYQIKGLADYIEHVFEICQDNQVIQIVEGVGSSICFRGQANSSWKLMPSILRDENGIDLKNESLYLSEFERQLPDECSHNCQFDTLVKAQHYGIPTRLLDFTINPLVSLYFACSDQSQMNEEGAVFVTMPQPIYYQDYPIALIHIHLLYQFKNMEIWDDQIFKIFNESLLSSYKSNFCGVDNPSEYLWNVSRGINPLFISPKLTNERVRAQNGLFAFYLTPLKQSESNETVYIQSKNKSDYQYPEYISETILIPAGLKKKLLEELRILGVSASTLFPGLEQNARDIVSSIRKRNI